MSDPLTTDEIRRLLRIPEVGSPAPYTDADRFWAIEEARVRTFIFAQRTLDTARLIRLGSGLTVAAVEPLPVLSDPSLGCEDVRHRVELMENEVERLDAFRRACLERSSDGLDAPRCVRFQKRHDLTLDHLTILTYLTSAGLSNDRALTGSYSTTRIDISDLPELTGVPASSIFDLLDESHGLRAALAVDGSFTNMNINASVDMHPSVLRVLRDQPVTLDDLYHLGEGPIYELVAEEGYTLEPDPPLPEGPAAGLGDPPTIESDPRRPTTEGFESLDEYTASYLAEWEGRASIMRKRSGQDPAALYRSDPDSIQAEIRAEEAKVRALVRKRNAQIAETDPLPHPEIVAQDLGLSDVEKRLLLLASLARIDPLIQHKLTGLVNSRRQVRLDPFVEIYATGLEERLELRQLVAEDGTLVDRGLIHASTSTGEIEEAVVEVSEGQAYYVLGKTDIPRVHVQGAYYIEWSENDRFDHLVYDETVMQIVEAVVSGKPSSEGGRGQLPGDAIEKFIISGDSGAGKSCLVRLIAHLSEAGIVNLALASTSGAATRALLRLGKLRGDVFQIDEADAALAARAPGNSTAEVIQELDQYDGLVFIVTTKPDALDPALNRRTEHIRIEHPTKSQRARIWQNHMPPSRDPLDRDAALRLAAEFPHLNGGGVHSVYGSVLRRVDARTEDSPLPVTADMLREAALAATRTQLATVGCEAHILPAATLTTASVDADVREELDLLVRRLSTKAGRSTLALLHTVSPGDANRLVEAMAGSLGRPVRRLDPRGFLAGAEDAEDLLAAVFQAAWSGEVLYHIPRADYHALLPGSLMPLIAEAVLLAETSAIFTAERLDETDPRLLRHVRAKIEVGTPSRATRAEIWTNGTRSWPHAASLDVGQLAREPMTREEIAEIIAVAETADSPLSTSELQHLARALRRNGNSVVGFHPPGEPDE